MARNVAFVAGAALLMLGATLAYGQVCGNHECQPSSSPSCKRGNKVPFIFQVGFQRTPSALLVNDTYRNTTIGPLVANYAYCAEVDQLQAFQLVDSITTATNLQTQIQTQYESWPTTTAPMPRSLAPCTSRFAARGPAWTKTRLP